MFKTLFLIFIGGGIGSILRYLIQVFIQANNPSSFPFSTLFANIIASFLVGFLAEKINSQVFPLWYRYLFITGFCGGLSTFSTFSYENTMLLTEKQIVLSTVYTTISVGACFLSTLIGMAVSKKI